MFLLCPVTRCNHGSRDEDADILRGCFCLAHIMVFAPVKANSWQLTPFSPPQKCSHLFSFYHDPSWLHTHLTMMFINCGSFVRSHSRCQVFEFPPLWSLLYGHPLESSWVPIWGHVSYWGKSWGKFLIMVSRLLRSPPKPFSCYMQLMRLCDCHSPNKVTDSVCAEGRTCKVYKPHLKSIFVFVYMSATAQVQTYASVSQRQ